MKSRQEQLLELQRLNIAGRLSDEEYDIQRKALEKRNLSFFSLSKFIKLVGKGFGIIWRGLSWLKDNIFFLIIDLWIIIVVATIFIKKPEVLDVIPIIIIIIKAILPF